MSNVQILIETTPNPEALKFVVGQRIADESRSFSSAEETSSSPLARKLFSFPWAKAVLIGENFVSVVKQDWVDWEVLAEPLSQLIGEHIERGEGILSRVQEAVIDDSPIAVRIREVLDAEIRPAVAMDGGDIIFQRFDNGRVFLHMQGACAGCPSSTFTLKEGIETRLREIFPEITEVIAV